MEAGELGRIAHCPLHPKYQGKREPSTDCPRCRLIYRQAHPKNRTDRRIGQQRATAASKRPMPKVEGNRPMVRCPSCGTPHSVLTIQRSRGFTGREVAKLVESFPVARADRYCDTCKPMHRQEHFLRRHPGQERHADPVRVTIKSAPYRAKRKAAA